jgi:predicted nuclease with TOPRIM domain
MKQSVFAMLLLIGLVMLCKVVMEPEKKPVKEIAPLEDYGGSIIKEKAEEVDSSLYEQIKELEIRNDSLHKEVENAKASLKESRYKAFRLQDKIALLSEAVKQEVDTVQKLAYCDSLQDEVQRVIVQAIANDSICDRVIAQLEQESDNLRSMVSEYKEGYNELKELLDETFKQNEALSLQLEDTEIKLGKVQRRNRFLGAGLVFMSGVVTTVAIHNQP